MNTQHIQVLINNKNIDIIKWTMFGFSVKKRRDNCKNYCQVYISMICID